MRQLTLAGVMTLARERAPVVHAAFARIASAEAAVARARAPLLPSVAIVGEGSGVVSDGQIYSGGIVSATSSDYYLVGQASILMRWALYDFGRTSSTIASAMAAAAEVRHAAAATQELAAADAAVAFFTLLADGDIVRAAREVSAERERALLITRQLVESGIRKPVDETRAEVALETAKLEVSIAEAAQETDSIFLVNALALDPQERFTLLAPAPSTAVDLTPQSAASAIRERHDVYAAAARLEGAWHGVEAARRARLPSITLGASGAVTYGYDRSSSSGGPLTTHGTSQMAQGSISVSIPLFDAQISADMLAAEGALKESEAVRDRVLAAARGEVAQAFANLHNARTVLEQTRRVAAGAKAGFDVVEELYVAGTESPLALSEAQREDARARFEVVRARLAVDVARVRALASVSRVGDLR